MDSTCRNWGHNGVNKNFFLKKIKRITTIVFCRKLWKNQEKRNGLWNRIRVRKSVTHKEGIITYRNQGRSKGDKIKLYVFKYNREKESP